VWIARRNGIALVLGHSVGSLTLQAIGAGALAVGLLLFVASLRRYAGEGRRRLAPCARRRRLARRRPRRRATDRYGQRVVVFAGVAVDDPVKRQRPPLR